MHVKMTFKLNVELTCHPQISITVLQVRHCTHSQTVQILRHFKQADRGQNSANEVTVIGVQ